MRNPAAIPGGSQGNAVKILVLNLKRCQETPFILFGGFDLKAVHLLKTELDFGPKNGSVESRKHEVGTERPRGVIGEH